MLTMLKILSEVPNAEKDYNKRGQARLPAAIHEGLSARAAKTSGFGAETIEREES